MYCVEFTKYFVVKGEEFISYIHEKHFIRFHLIMSFPKSFQSPFPFILSWVFFLISNLLSPPTGASQGALVVKNLPANSGDIRDADSIIRSGGSPGGGHGNPLQYSCLENSMDRGAWEATVHEVTKSQKRLKHLSIPPLPLPHHLLHYPDLHSFISLISFLLHSSCYPMDRI